MVLYYANRDRVSYLDFESEEAHSIVSVAGGLGFLYFLNQNSRKLCIIDNNPEQIEYSKLILELIRKSRDLFHFIRLVSGADPHPGAFRDTSCCAKTDMGTSPLSEEYLAPYAKYIEANFSNPSIDYYGDASLEPGRFYWRFGSSHPISPFRNNESFTMLSESLRRLSVESMVGDLCNLDYGSLVDPNLLNLFCVTNADFAFYTPGDRILRKMVETIKVPCRVLYHSWDRTIRFSPGLHHEDTLLRLQPLTEGRDIVEIRTYVGAKFSQASLKARSLEQISLDEIEKFYSYKNPADCLLYHISLEPGCQRKEEVVRNILSAAYRNFRRIIILDHLFASNVGTWMSWCMELKFPITYFVSCIEFAGGEEAFSRNFIMCWDERGAV